MSTTVTPTLTPPLSAQFDLGSELHAPELYQPQPGATAVSVARLQDIGPREIALYREHGYLVVREAFTSVEVGSAIAGLLHLIMGGNPQFDGVQFEAKAQEVLPTLSPEQRQDAVRKLWLFSEFEPRMKALSAHPALLAVVRRLLDGAQPFMFQDMALVKPPRLGREKPWHQDHAYFDYPLGTPIVGVWIALDEATIENGCMQLLPGRHREGPIVHFKRRDWQICDQDILPHKQMALPMDAGDIMIFHAKLPHGTPTNRTKENRWALQYHYVPQDARQVGDEVRLAAFGSEGKNVTC